MLAAYHAALATALGDTSAVPGLPALADALEVAYADLARFMSGWGFWGADYLEARARAVMDRVDGGTPLATVEEYERAVQQAYPLPVW